MVIAFFKQYSQGLYVAGCALMSGTTLGYMMVDAHKNEKKQIINKYEKQIKLLNNETKITKLKY